MIPMKNTHTHITLIAIGLTMAGAGLSQAVLVNQYTFNDGTTNDGVGGQNGILAGGASVDSGLLHLTGGSMAMPPSIFTSAASGGTGGEVSIAAWTLATSNSNWAAIASFGPGPIGNNTPNPGTQDYIQLIAQHGAGGATLRTTTHAAGVGTEGFVDGAAALSTSSMQHLVTTYNQTSGILEFFVDGSSVGTEVIAGGLDLNTFNDAANSLGQSQWADPAFLGDVDQFEIYDTALTSGEVTAAFNAGAVQVPEPSSTALLGLGGITLLLRRRK